MSKKWGYAEIDGYVREQARLWVCMDCGAWVMQPETHDEFHEAVGRRIPREEVEEEWFGRDWGWSGEQGEPKK